MTYWRHRLAAFGCAVWFIAMVYLAATSANPPVVSGPQVLSASAVVEGRIQSGADVRLVVDKVLWSRRPLNPNDFAETGIVVTLPAMWPKNISTVVAPLEEVEPGRFRVQPIPFELKPPDNAERAPIYPATSLVYRQLERFRPKDG